MVGRPKIMDYSLCRVPKLSCLIGKGLKTGTAGGDGNFLSLDLEVQVFNLGSSPGKFGLMVLEFGLLQLLLFHVGGHLFVEHGSLIFKGVQLDFQVLDLQSNFLDALSKLASRVELFLKASKGIRNRKLGPLGSWEEGSSLIQVSF